MLPLGRKRPHVLEDMIRNDDIEALRGKGKLRVFYKKKIKSFSDLELIHDVDGDNLTRDLRMGAEIVRDSPTPGSDFKDPDRIRSCAEVEKRLDLARFQPAGSKIEHRMRPAHQWLAAKAN